MPSPAERSTPSSTGPGFGTYVKHAFRYHWNLLLFFGGAALAAVSPWPDALLPIVGALELAYLTGLSSIPRFRTAIEAKLAAERRGQRAAPQPNGQTTPTLQQMLERLPPAAIQRFMTLRQRCSEMRDIASGVRGQAESAGSADSIRTPALDRLLFLFLRLLVTQAALARFLRTTSERELELRVEDLRIRLKEARGGGGEAPATQSATSAASSTTGSDGAGTVASDERVIRSLQDSLADAELRLDNYRKSMKDAQFVDVELDRIETKIQALIEMGVSRQDPDTLSHQVTAAAESMRYTEDAVNQLQHLTGLADQLEEPPAILTADIGRAYVRGR